MKLFIISFLSLLFMATSAAQVLKAKVTIDYGHLPIEEQNYLVDLALNIEDYINNYVWTEDEYETDIDMTIFIIIETVLKKSHEKIYKSQFQIKSISGESFYDKEWEFPYQPGYLFDHSKIEFDPLLNYAHLILAG